MSLSFPSAPSVGQTYNQFKWDGVKWTEDTDRFAVTSFNGSKGAVSFVNDRTLIKGFRVPQNQQIVTSPTANVWFFYTFTNAFDEYEIDIYNLQSETDGAPVVYCSADGSSFDMGNNYFNAWGYANVGGGSNLGGGNLSYVWIGQWLSPGAANHNFYRIRMILPWRTDQQKFFRTLSFTNSGTTSFTVQHASSYWNNVSQIKALNFRFHNGARFLRGTFNLYGISKFGAIAW